MSPGTSIAAECARISPDIPVRREPAADQQSSPRGGSLRQPVQNALAASGFLFLALTIQFLSGAFGAEFAGYPDEASHYVTGLMVRDYIADGFPSDPIQYATDYYRRYPRIAIGHWPPVFYAVEAGWMLAFGHSRTSILVLMAFITALTAGVIAAVVRRGFNTATAIVCGCAFIVLPEIQWQTALIVPEVLVAFFGFAAAIHLGRYLETGERRDSLWFALYASLCILTKGNGWAIVLAPPIAVLLRRQPGLLFRPASLMGGLLIGVLCWPWHAFTAQFLKHVWTGDTASPAYVVSNAAQVIARIVQALGWPVFVFAIAGLVLTCVSPAIRKRTAGGEYAAFASVIVAVCAFNAAVPLEIEARKLVMAIPPMVVLMAAGFGWAVERLPNLVRRDWVLPGLIAATVLVTHGVTVRQKRVVGFIPASDVALASSFAGTSVQLVSGSALGEGAFIAEIAMRDTARRIRVARATKELAEMDWNGGHYRPRFKTTDELHKHLRDRSVSVVVAESVAERAAPVHHVLLTTMLREHSHEWPEVPLDVPEGSHPRVRVFRRAFDETAPPARSEPPEYK
jgi:hypothetical protein